MKKLLLSLFGIITLGLVNFGSCLNVSGLITDLGSVSTTIDSHTYYTVYHLNDESEYGTYCLHVTSFSNSLYVGIHVNPYSYNNEWGSRMYDDRGQDFYYCIFSNLPYINLYNPNSTGANITYSLFKLNALLDTPVPVMTSLECQENYSLIPISSVNSNYCEINGLCPVCPVCPELSGGFSNFYVYSDGRYNQLSGTYNYYVNIPDYLDYSYDYSNGGDDLDLDIGVSVDTGYISSVKGVQGSIPNQVDLNNIITGLLPLFVPGLCIILLLYFIFRFVKKVF